MNKILYLDIETTGLTPQHGIVEIGFIVEIDGEIKEESLFKIKPFPEDMLSQSAMDITGYTEEDLMSFEDAHTVKNKIFKIFDKYVDRYDKNDKFILAGYNIRSFDFPMLLNWFSKMNERYFGAYVDFKTKLDVLAMLENMRVVGVLKNTRFTKLTEVCEEYGIELKDAHSSIADIKATRDLYKKLIKIIFDK